MTEETHEPKHGAPLLQRPTRGTLAWEKVAPELGVAQVIGGVLYQESATEETRRCLGTATVFQLERAARGIGIIFGVVAVFFFALFGLLNAGTHSWQDFATAMGDVVKIIVFGVSGLLLAVLLLIALVLAGERLVLLNRVPDTAAGFLLIQQGIYQTARPDRSFLAYADIDKVIERRGNIVVLQERTVIGGAYWVPATAFRDREQAQRFATMIEQLRRIDDNPKGRNEALRAEFALEYERG